MEAYIDLSLNSVDTSSDKHNSEKMADTKPRLHCVYTIETFDYQ